MASRRKRRPVIGLAMTSVDAHTLGVSFLSELLSESGYRTVTADSSVRDALDNPQKLNNAGLIEKWIRDNDINLLGFSYRLDPNDAVDTFGRLMYQLADRKMFKEDGGPLSRVYFAGLPDASRRVSGMYDGRVGTFCGDETPRETFEKLGLDISDAPAEFMETHPYDDMLMDFGRYVIQKGDYLSVKPVKRRYPEFG
ncbi:MAG: hypothetical protein J7K54_03360, partial [Candidatus Aenigmarchaeota archaeon]|nr:hypothetical protein [Candidatus Aenigmarchaeota archaeon]